MKFNISCLTLTKVELSAVCFCCRLLSFRPIAKRLYWIAWDLFSLALPLLCSLVNSMEANMSRSRMITEMQVQCGNVFFVEAIHINGCNCYSEWHFGVELFERLNILQYIAREILNRRMAAFVWHRWYESPTSFDFMNETYIESFRVIFLRFSCALLFSFPIRRVYTQHKWYTPPNYSVKRFVERITSTQNTLLFSIIWVVFVSFELLKWDCPLITIFMHNRPAISHRLCVYWWAG